MDMLQKKVDGIAELDVEDAEDKLGWGGKIRMRSPKSQRRHKIVHYHILHFTTAQQAKGIRLGPRQVKAQEVSTTNSNAS